MAAGSRRGPDWTLLEGRQATLFECKTTRLTRVEREDSRIPDVRERLRQDIIDALLKLPTKIKHIRRRVSGFEDWPEIEDLECVIVTLEPWWPEMLTRETIDTELKGTPAEGLRYHLMWVEQLEHLGSYGSVTTIFDLLRRRWQAPTDWDTRKYLFEEAKRLGIVTRSPRLDHLAEEFFGQLTGGGTAEAEVG